MDTKNNTTNEGQATVFLFDTWIDLLTKGEISDCKRYHDDFFNSYGEQVKDEKAPLYLMFCAFVGAMDIVDMIDTN